MNNKLLFFNKEGYPYNFHWNDEEEYYEGKLFFDHNSSDTFKTLALYTFEEVKPIQFEDEFKLNKIELYNQSGMTFTPFASSGATITNITKVNSDGNFNSKWIFGDNFDKLYEKGMIVSFDSINFTDTVGTPVSNTDFDASYYTVLENKPNAILVKTETSNDNWNFIYLTGGTINTHNIIAQNDYNNTIITNVESYTFHDNKKLNIIDTDLNEGIKTYVNSATTETYYNTYELTGDTGEVLRLDLTLFTERPKIYQGEVIFNISGSTSTLTFTKGLNSFFNIEEGQSFIFEDYDDNAILPSNPIFTVQDGAGEYDLYNGETVFTKEVNTNASIIDKFNNKDTKETYKYTITIKEDVAYPLVPGDIIELSAVTSNSPKNDRRKYTVKNYKSFRNTRTQYWSQKISNDINWSKTVESTAINNERTVNEQLTIESLYMYNTNDNNINSNNYIPLEERYNTIETVEYVLEESNTNDYNIKKLVESSNVLICDVSPTSIYTGFTMNVIAYDTSNTLNFEQTILAETGSTSPDYSATINAFNTQYASILDDYGIYVFYDDKLNVICKWSEDFFTTEVYANNVYVSGQTDTLVDTLYLEVNEDLTKEEILLNEKEKFAKNYSAEIKFNLQSNNTKYGYTLYCNDNEYFIEFDTDTDTTIHSFISTYGSIFDNLGVTLSSGSTTLYLDGKTPNVNLYSLSVRVNSYSSYEIVNEDVGDGIFIVGNEIEIPTGKSYTFFDYELSTGMIINVSGSSYLENNKQYNIIGLTESIIELSYQGTFIESQEIINIQTELFLRKPRESYDKDIYYSYKWDTINEDMVNTTKDIFFYDFTGEHLKPYLDDTRLTYTGPKPLWDTEDVCSEQNEQIYLRDEPNQNLEWVNDPTKQQTVFRGLDGEYALEYLLEQLDSSNDYNYSPEPLQMFLGFNSTSEGVSKSTVVMDKVENILYSGYTNSEDYPTNINFKFTEDGILTITTSNINFNFNYLGFEKNQDIDIDFTDLSPTGTTIFKNYGPFRVLSVSNNKIVIDPDRLDYNISDFYSSGNTYSFKYVIKTVPRTLLKLQVLGSTEIEEERYEVSLNNLGIHIGFDEEHIFKESDINEDGYDYVLLNAKRKEMLSTFPEIYNHVGSYKAIINSINYFGWNDLDFNEYYRNVNVNSPLYKKLHRVQIPDMFDNTVLGWTSNDWIEGKYQNGNWKKTNLFNLSYKITDEHGNNILLYSLKEVQVKLNKLKKWLQRNMVPLSANIVDVTGVAEADNNNYQQFDVSNQSIKLHSTSETDIVNFNYTSTLNFETNYLFQVDFYTLSGNVPSGWTAKIKTFSKSDDGSKLIPQKYYKILKNDLEPFSFNADKIVDQYLYIETQAYNEYGVAQVYNKMINTSTTKNYLLVNNNFKIPTNYTDKYISTGQNMDEIYYFDKDGYIYLED